MIRKLLGLASLTRDTLRDNPSAQRLACGVAMGMAMGLIPKQSLFVYLLGTVLLISTANILCAMVSTFVFSWVGFLIDPLTHKLGGLVLGSDKMRNAWANIYDLPLAPWTHFNNTVVMGNIILALLLFYPVYRLSHLFFDHFGERMHRRLSRSFLYRWIVGTEPATS